MKDKLIFFIIVLVLAGGMVIFGSETKSIVCSNRNKTCYSVTENSLLQSKKKGFVFDVSHKHENTTNDFGNETDLGHFACKARRTTIHENSKTSSKVRYYLVPFSQRHGLKFSRPKALNHLHTPTSFQIRLAQVQVAVKLVSLLTGELSTSET